MQLRSARLCLDCDEVHDAQRCPHCASETFAYLTRWVTAPDRPDRPQSRARSPEPTSEETLGAYQEMLNPDQVSGGKWRTIRRGAVGLALVGIAGWLWRKNNRPDDTGSTGEDATTDKRA